VTSNAGNRSSSYLEYLPSIYQADAEKGAFLGRYLKIYEKILSGRDDGVTTQGAQVEGIEQVIDRIHEFFAPETTTADFLQWLAGWMALTLRQDWEESKKRRLISRILSLYRIRGTKRALEEYIKIYLPGVNVQITEVVAPLQVGVTSTVGEDTYIGGSPAHFFHVTIILPVPDLNLAKIQERGVRAIIDLEKPAHTYYELTNVIPTFQIGVYSHVGVDTLLGDIP
jgi:phage tail-like protein